MIAAGTRLGRYEILAPLGAGGMGEVYCARDTRLDRKVAVKVLPTAFAADPLRQARFEQEARAVAALSHPNILAIHDYGTEGCTGCGSPRSRWTRLPSSTYSMTKYGHPSASPMS